MTKTFHIYFDINDLELYRITEFIESLKHFKKDEIKYIDLICEKDNQTIISRRFYDKKKSRNFIKTEQFFMKDNIKINIVSEKKIKNISMYKFINVETIYEIKYIHTNLEISVIKYDNEKINNETKYKANFSKLNNYEIDIKFNEYNENIKKLAKSINYVIRHVDINYCAKKIYESRT